MKIFYIEKMIYDLPNPLFLWKNGKKLGFRSAYRVEFWSNTYHDHLNIKNNIKSLEKTGSVISIRSKTKKRRQNRKNNQKFAEKHI